MACPFDNPYEESAAPRRALFAAIPIATRSINDYVGRSSHQLSELHPEHLAQVFTEGLISRMQFKRAVKIRRHRETREARLGRTPIR